MSIERLIHNYAAYNAWANVQAANWLETLDDALLYGQINSSFNSIDYTVQHILRVQKFWHAFMKEMDVSAFDWTVFENDARRILKELKEQSAAMSETISAFTIDDLQRTLVLATPWASSDLARYEYIMHAVNHSTYHRGQIITIARMLGVAEAIPSTEYNNFNSLKSA